MFSSSQHLGIKGPFSKDSVQTFELPLKMFLFYLFKVYISGSFDCDIVRYNKTVSIMGYWQNEKNYRVLMFWLIDSFEFYYPL